MPKIKRSCSFPIHIDKDTSRPCGRESVFAVHTTGQLVVLSCGWHIKYVHELMHSRDMPVLGTVAIGDPMAEIRRDRAAGVS